MSRLSRNESSVRDIVRVHDPAQRIVEQARIVPVVEPPLKLFKITVHMLSAHLVKRPYDGTLEQGPDALDAVGVHVADNPLFLGMPDGFMPGVMVRDSEIGFQLVGVDGFRFVLDGAPDKVMERPPFDVGDALDADVPPPLDGPGDPGLVSLVGSPLVLCPASYKRFVHFHDAEQRWPLKRIVAHSLPDSVAEIPGRPVGDAEGSLKLKRGDAFLDSHIR